MPHLTIPKKLEPFLTKHKRFKIAFGGRGAAKSQSFADMFLMKSQAEGAKIGCFREMQNSIEDSVHSLLSKEIERLELQTFTTEKASIYNGQGGEFRFRGLARNPDAVKSMHGFKYFWVEEAQSISEESLKLLTPTLREDDSEIWMSLNPGSSEDPVSKRFLQPFMADLLRDGYYEDDMHLIVWINYTDNPWFPAVLEQERQFDEKNLSRAEYNHIWLGYYNDEVANSIIPVDWFDAAIDAHTKLGIKPRGQKIVAHDPADSGDDRAYAVKHGILVKDVKRDDKLDVNDACDWALDAAINEKADLFVWDADGLGVSLRRQVSQSLSGKKISYSEFHGGGSVDKPDGTYLPIEKNESHAKKNKDTFKNRRAQNYWKLRDRFYNTYLAVEKKQYIDPDDIISISSDIECINQLRAEICRIPKKPNGAGLIQIMGKEEMKRILKINSPNLADCLMMMEEQSKGKKEMEPLTYDLNYVI